MNSENGKSIYKIIEDLYLYNRTIVSDGFDDALMYLRNKIEFEIIEIPSGTECWTWIIPPKWTVNDAIIKEGDKVILDIQNHPLHVAAYSEPFEGVVDKEELKKHLRWSEMIPDALVYEHRYAYHYRKKDWCLSMPYNQVKRLKSDSFYVKIDTEFTDGTMKIGECILPGEREECIVIMGHLCHPGQAEDGLSGVAVGVRFFQELAKKRKRKYTYILLMLPETIGSVGYLWKRQSLISKMKYGIFLEAMGADNSMAVKYSYDESTYIDRIAHNVLKFAIEDFREGSFHGLTLAGNDELVFGDPDFNIPMISIQRFPYAEIHSNFDNPSISSIHRLTESYNILGKIVEVLETDYVPKRNFHGPLYLSRYELYVDPHSDDSQNINMTQKPKGKNLHKKMRLIMQNLDNRQSVFEIADRLEIDYFDLFEYLKKWEQAGLISKSPDKD